MASFLQGSFGSNRVPAEQAFSSLSESGFIPTKELLGKVINELEGFSSLSESGFIPTRGGAVPHNVGRMFSSLSESGFIPTSKRVRHRV